jgi:DNA-binding transcriptional MerR regulator
MKMRDLENKSGVGRETIRFYIREGLLPEPERRARNVALYGEAHVARLKTIKRLQEERFLPLDVIRRVLDGDTGGLPASVAPFPELGPLVAERLGVSISEPPIPLATLVAGDAGTAADIAVFRRLGIVRVVRHRGNDCLSRLDARIVTLWRDVRRAGYPHAEFPPEQIQTYAEPAAAMAAIEVGRFYDRFAGKIAEGEAAALAQTAIETLNTLFGTLRIRAILDEVAKRAPIRVRQRR